MTIINKQHISELILMETYAELHKLQDKIKAFEKKYNSEFKDFENNIQQEAEDFEKYDDYIEWKSCISHLQDLKEKVKDIKSGNYQVS